MPWDRANVSRCAGLLLTVACASPLAAQYLNRATWLGVESEEMRRDFHQGVEYYLDRFSYVIAPPWRDRGLLRFADGARYRFGSISTKEFTVEGSFDHSFDLGSGWGLGYHVLQSENRDTRFLRNAIELELPIGAESALFAQGELFAEKEMIDVSLGAWLLRSDDNALRVMLTAVDAPSNKSSRIEYERDPYAVMVAGAFGDRERHRIAFELAGQLPFTMRDLELQQTLEMQRWIGVVETQLRLGERDRLVGTAELEWTDKALATEAAGASLTEDYDRGFRQLRLEWWRCDPEIPWSVGVFHTWLDERGAVPGDPGRELRIDRDEWFGTARAAVRVSERVVLEPQLFAGHVRQFFLEETRDHRVRGFEGRFALNARCEFSPTASMTFLLMAELDEWSFGGGGVQFVANF